MAQADEDPLVELITFQCKECYVYAPLPPVNSFGHRAELWGVDDWLKSVGLKLITLGEYQCKVRLEDLESGELFAECPLPSDGTSLTTAVEPVVDSSRYFVLRVVDTSDGKHAFIGVGFRERNEASAFTAALDDYRQFLRRHREAAAMREQFEAAGQQDGDEAPVARSGSDFSLKDGQTIKLSLKNSLKQRAGDASTPQPALRTTSNSESSTNRSGAGGALKLPLPPPPPPSSSLTAPAAVRAGTTAAAAAHSLNRVSNPATPVQLSPESSAGQLARMRLSDGGTGTSSSNEQPGTAAHAAAQPAAPLDDAWGDFVG